MISGYKYLNTFYNTSTNLYESFDIGCSYKNRATIHVHNCSNSVNTFVVFNPRYEYLGNLYHAMEEVYSLYQTAKILKIDIRFMNLVFINPITVHPRYIELFQLVVRNVYVRKKIAKDLCYVEPLRACSGSYLPLTWSSVEKRYDSLSLDIANHILRNIRVHPQKQTLLMTRKNAKTRRLKEKNFFIRCLNTTQYRVKLFQDLKKNTMRQQIKLVADSEALIGPHGAGLTLGMFLPPQGVLIEISDTQNVATRSVNNIYRNIAHFTNHRHHYLQTKQQTCTRLLSFLKN